MMNYFQSKEVHFVNEKIEKKCHMNILPGLHSWSERMEKK